MRKNRKFITVSDYEIPNVPGLGTVVLDEIFIEMEVWRGEIGEIITYDYDTKKFTDDQLNYIDKVIEEELLDDSIYLLDLWGEQVLPWIHE
jgi:hypothetical protein